MPNRKLFIGSSREANEKSNCIQWIQNRIKAALPDIDTFDWTSNSIWKNGHSTLSNLVEISKEFHYAIFVFFPDDLIKLRGTDYYTTRDNVIFEAGLFYSQFGEGRTFIFKPTGLINAPVTSQFRIATDFDGIVFTGFKLDYDVSNPGHWKVDQSDNFTSENLDNVCNTIYKKEQEIKIASVDTDTKINNVSNKIESYLTELNKTDEYYIGYFAQYFQDIARYKSIQINKPIQDLLTDILIAVKKINDVLDIKQLATEQSKANNPNLEKVWVFADKPLEFKVVGASSRLRPQLDELKRVIHENLQAGVRYVYFVNNNFDEQNYLNTLVNGDTNLLQNIEVIKCNKHNFLTFFTLHFEKSQNKPSEIFVSFIDKDRDDLLIKIPDNNQIDSIFENLAKIKGNSVVTNTYKVFDRTHI